MSKSQGLSGTGNAADADQTVLPISADQSVGGVSRRNLVRAGLAAAPVLLVLKSQSALANGTGTGTHCKPSVWASIKAAGGCRSHSPQQVGGTCKNFDYWPDNKSEVCNRKYHNSNLTDSGPFDGNDFGQDSTLKDVCRGSRKVTKNGQPQDESLSTGNASKDKFGKHCASMYLNKTVRGSCPVDVETVKTIWRSCKDGGTWSPAPGAAGWTRDDCNEYFDYISTGTTPPGWKTCG